MKYLKNRRKAFRGGVTPSFNYMPLVFDGSELIHTSPFIPASNDKLHVHIRVKIDPSQVAFGTFASQYNGGVDNAQQRLFIFFYDSGEVTLAVRTTSGYRPLTTSGFTKGVWTDFDLTYDGSTLRGYQDQVEFSNSSFTEVFDLGQLNNMSIGGQRSGASSNNQCNCVVSEFEILNTPIDVNDLAGFNFSWSRSPAVRDSIGRAYNLNTGVAEGIRFINYGPEDATLTLVGSPSFTADAETFAKNPNKFNMMQFTGSPQSVTNPTINIGNKYTISFRFYHNDFSPSDQNQFDMNLGSGNVNTGPRLEASGGTPELKLHWASAANGTGLGDTVILNLGAISAQRVYDFAMTMDNGSVVAYLDGEQVGSSPSTHGFETVFNGIAWGNGFASRYMDGSVSDVMLFDDALSIEEIKIIHNKKTPKFYDKLPRSIREKCVLAMPLNSNDDSALDITGYGNNGTKNGGIVADGAEINVSNEQFSPVDLGGCLLSINADDGFVDLSPLQQAVTNTGGVTIVPNAYNSKATFTFNGTNYLSVPDILSGTGSKSMYAVYKSTSNSPPYVDAVCGQGTGAVASSWFVLQSRDSGPAGDPYFAGFGDDLGSDSPDNLLKQVGVTYDTVTARLRKNRTLNASGAKTLNTVVTTFKIGNNDTGGTPEPMNGDIPTVDAFDRDLNTSEEDMVESFYEEQYGI